jgi:endonuclease YncB( thermonuclease family)
MMYYYPFRLVEVIDGDTIVVDIDCGLNNWEHDAKIRFLGIDTKELKDSNADSKKLAWEAKAFVDIEIRKAVRLEMRTFKNRRSKEKKDTFGSRWLAEIFVDGISLNQKLLDAGLARVISENG